MLQKRISFLGLSIWLFFIYSPQASFSQQDPVPPQHLLTIPVGSEPAKSAAVRLDAQGNMGIAVTNSHSKSVSVIRIDRDLSPSVSELSMRSRRHSCSSQARTPNYVLAADVRGEGYDDIFVTVSAGACSAMLWFINDGYGGFSFYQDTAKGELWFPEEIDMYPSQIVAGDVNNNGLIDIIIAHSSPYAASRFSVLLNQGNGVFSRTRHCHVGSWQPFGLSAIALGDMNGNGWNDLVLGFATQRQIAIMENKEGNPGRLCPWFHEFSRDAGNLGPVEHIVLKNLNGNEFLDIVSMGNGSIGSFGSTMIGAQLIFNLFDETENRWRFEFQPFPIGKESVSFVVGDFRGKGEIDFVAPALFGDTLIYVSNFKSPARTLQFFDGMPFKRPRSIVQGKFIPGLAPVFAITDFGTNSVVLVEGFKDL